MPPNGEMAFDRRRDAVIGRRKRRAAPKEVLEGIEAEVDPGNVFRLTQNVSPD
jgi:hypothetical protein